MEQDDLKVNKTYSEKSESFSDLNTNTLEDNIIVEQSDIFDNNATGENNTENSDKGKIVKNIIFVAISNVLKLIAGVLVGFIIPKIMGETNYGFYKTFTLYLGYVGLFHFGFCDGIYLIVAGTKYENLDKNKFRAYSKFYLIFEGIISLLILIPAVITFNTSYGFIFMFVGLSLLANNITNYYQIISQITSRFKELSFRNIIYACLTSISIIILAFLYYFKIINELDFKIYVFISFMINLILAIWYIYSYRDLTFGKCSSIREIKNDILYFFKVGFPLLIANLLTGLILTVDRQFANVLVNIGNIDIADFGVYSFSYNMLALITTVISAISTVLYPSIKTYTDEKLKSDYDKLISIIAIITGACLLSYFPLCFIVETWLPKYIDSLRVFRIILPSVVLSSCISMVMFNYYKTLNKHVRFFVISLIILVLAIVADLIAYLIGKELVWISGASILVMIVWYFFTEFFIVRKYHLNPIRNIIYIFTIIVSYYLIAFFINNLILGFALYFIVFMFFSFIILRKVIIYMLKRR